jgi:hypothetical protein
VRCAGGGDQGDGRRVNRSMNHPLTVWCVDCVVIRETDVSIVT